MCLSLFQTKDHFTSDSQTTTRIFSLIVLKNWQQFILYTCRLLQTDDILTCLLNGHKGAHAHHWCSLNQSPEKGRRSEHVSSQIWLLHGPLVFVLVYLCLSSWRWYLQAFGNLSQIWNRPVEVHVSIFSDIEVFFLMVGFVPVFSKHLPKILSKYDETRISV